MTRTLPTRSEVPLEQTWDATRIFATHADFETALSRVVADAEAMARYQGQLARDGDTLLAALDESFALRNEASKLWVYADMFFAVDSGNSDADSRNDRAMSAYVRVQTATAFIAPELLALPDKTLEEWTAQDSRLAVYCHYFDNLRRRRSHIRSTEVEALLGEVADSFTGAENTHNALANTNLVFAPAHDASGAVYEVAQGTINALLADPDRVVRQTAYEHYADSFLAYKHTAASALATGIKQNVFLARARLYPSALDASLDASAIPLTVFHNLIATYQSHLPVWHRYWDVRRQALQLERLHVYDIKAPLTGKVPTVPFAEAVKMIVEGMQPLGDEYVAALRRGVMEERWVDIYPNRGKRMGAYSSGTQGTHPYIFMNYNDDLFGMSTLAHELGHSLHSYYTRASQPAVYADYSLFVAEVASNFNQALVRAHLLRTRPEPEFQIAVIEEAMANFHRYFFVMPTLARFELAIHERVERGDALTADTLNALMFELFREGYGEGVEVEEDRVGITWAQFPTHLYSNFYVYQYATGISGAHSLALGVLNQKPNAVENYLSFLKAGGSLYPLDALRQAGVDLTSPQPVEETFDILFGLVDRLAALLDIR